MKSFTLMRGDKVKLPARKGKPEMTGVVVDRTPYKHGFDTQYGIEVGLPYWVWRRDTDLIKLKGE